MPIYGYACKSCGFEKDVLQKMSDAPLTQCPECNEESFSKKLSAPGFRLKGGGWYETDFKTGKKKNLAGESANKEGGSKEGGSKEGSGKAGNSKEGNSKEGSAKPSKTESSTAA